METPAELSEWLRMYQEMPRVPDQRACERSAVRRCRRACTRATLKPCIKACFRAVASPAVREIALPSILRYVIDSRDKLLKENEHRSDNEQRALSILTNNCLKTCVPQWTKQWTAFCDAVFKRVCIRTCTGICERNCRRSCRLPCTRTPLDRMHVRDKAQLHVGTCLVLCLTACAYECKRTCKLLVPWWFKRRGKHICKPVLNVTAQKLAVKWLAEDIIEERKVMTDKCNVLNSCKF